MGKMDEWQKWKPNTECASDGSGYKQVLTYETYAALNTQMNQVVYSQSAVATVGGTSHHLIKQFEDYKNGYGAWNSLCEWQNRGAVKKKIMFYEVQVGNLPSYIGS